MKPADRTAGKLTLIDLWCNVENLSYTYEYTQHLLVFFNLPSLLIPLSLMFQFFLLMPLFRTFSSVAGAERGGTEMHRDALSSLPASCTALLVLGATHSFPGSISLANHLIIRK